MPLLQKRIIILKLDFEKAFDSGASGNSSDNGAHEISSQMAHVDLSIFSSLDPQLSFSMECLENFLNAKGGSETRGSTFTTSLCSGCRTSSDYG